MWQKFWLIKKKKKAPLLIFDFTPFWLPHLFWNFVHLLIKNPTLKPVNKSSVPTTLTQNSHHWTGIVIRLEKRHTWSKYVFNVKAAFSWSAAMSCRRNSPNLSGVQITESAKNDNWSSRQNILWITSLTLACLKDFVASQPGSCIHWLSHNCFHMKN